MVLPTEKRPQGKDLIATQGYIIHKFSVSFCDFSFGGKGLGRKKVGTNYQSLYKNIMTVSAGNFIDTKYNIQRLFSFCNHARFLIYILRNQLFALKYTLKHSLIKIISTPTCFGLIRPSSGSCHA